MKSFTKKDLERIAEIINSHIPKEQLNCLVPPVTAENVMEAKTGTIDFIGYDPIKTLFRLLAKDRYADLGQFHHFKSFSVALDIIKSKSIQVSNLVANQENDFAEFSEFYKRVGLYKGFIPLDYPEQLKKGAFNANALCQLDLTRENTFILCLTQDNHNEKFWHKYGRNDTGIAIGLRFSEFREDQKRQYNFRDVFYDSGYSLDFLNQINYDLKREFGSMLYFSDLHKFTPFYKRGKYSWENETRLSFMYKHENYNLGVTLDSVFPIQTDQHTMRKYICLPIDNPDMPNPLFKLTIDEVVCGSKVTDTQFQELKKQLLLNFPKSLIWKRPVDLIDSF